MAQDPRAAFVEGLLAGRYHGGEKELKHSRVCLRSVSFSLLINLLGLGHRGPTLMPDHSAKAPCFNTIIALGLSLNTGYNGSLNFKTFILGEHIRTIAGHKGDLGKLSQGTESPNDEKAYSMIFSPVTREHQLKW